MFLKSALKIAAAVAAVSALSTGALAQEVSGVRVTAKAPTSIRVNIAGLDHAGVRHVVFLTARQVCRNAVHNAELGTGDMTWCVGGTTDRTMFQYRRLQEARRFAAGPDTLTIASR